MTEADAIFDAISKAACFIIRQDKISAKQKEIANCKEKNCGHCDHWMKSSCKPEKELKQFKSAASMPCKDFSIASYLPGLIASREAELTNLTHTNE